MRNQIAVLAAVATIAGLAALPLNAGDGHAQTGRHRPVDPHRRAGYAQETRRLAHPTYTSDYSSGWVGGGAVGARDPRAPHEGVWGRDYSGLFYPRRVWSSWLHGARSQGGVGAYKSDGPHLKRHK